MTFSIVARCPRTGQFGVAAATAMPAVGKLLSHAAAGAGAVATQAQVNPYLGLDGLALLRQGLSARQVLERLKATDPCMELRQCALIDAQGDSLCWTGEKCIPWAGSLAGEQFSVQGNRLVGPQVLDAVAEAFRHAEKRPLIERLIEALAAGDRCGGDRHGESSAVIYVVDQEEYPLWDIRVDHHLDPVAELRRLHKVFAREVLPEILAMPTRDNPAGLAAEDSV
ncbi:DUF1028 domain-containing protein [Pseudomonas chengduensis]|uniref:Uncharacterized conserved protein, Ntn-hydrolase superfamily n=2 Tax=Pseudomonadaceae TaxID=135621 RepID=A0A1H2LYJ8_9PSED|nr:MULTISPECIES: DUF1028 domain-containing protein [Pseudomonas]KQO30574.1 hypothetical protein ASF15_12560 [Pseudomonas sp. Leaf83]MBP3061143.1 DUF1028 domain-containing protein [Pseudomonas chengduensis]MDH0957386.1 DUF1028 domain-containing protein [Pseudomonas chengduensis]MDH1535432.1 DUF1028 domain-containing protein [Pseudomonas chengduensis]MDH1620742.1 DUF1028 domain-containing protein [Pseudomonas chengduensis]